jgi:hypothetical protein
MHRPAPGRVTSALALTPAGSRRPRLGVIEAKITSISTGLGRRLHPVVRRLGTVTPDRWFTLFFLLLILAFVVVLLVQPTGVGRGGR